MGRWHFDVFVGVEFEATLVYEIDGVPVDLSGWGADMAFRRKRTGQVEVTLSTEPGADGTITLGADGTIELRLDDAVTADLVPGEYEHDLILVDPDGDRQPPLVAGNVTIKRTVTP